MELASAVPLMVGVASFVVDPEAGAVMVGLAGPEVSMVISLELEVGEEVFPAASEFRTWIWPAE